MSVTRIGGALQPAWARATTAIVETSSSFGTRLQPFLEYSVATARDAFQQQLANVLVTLLTPTALLALVFALWRFSADLGWTGSFLITAGLFSHWQVWAALAIVLKALASSIQTKTHARAKTSDEN
ncbi:MAG TPA: hypothetical protein VEV17_09970 [Bryobacteraceae bacterium]|nr:hypothetical protein [Bryobacteraceae bacterium]